MCMSIEASRNVGADYFASYFFAIRAVFSLILLPENSHPETFSKGKVSASHVTHICRPGKGFSTFTLSPTVYIARSRDLPPKAARLRRLCRSYCGTTSSLPPQLRKEPIPKESQATSRDRYRTNWLIRPFLIIGHLYTRESKIHTDEHSPPAASNTKADV